MRRLREKLASEPLDRRSLGGARPAFRRAQFVHGALDRERQSANGGGDHVGVFLIHPGPGGLIRNRHVENAVFEAAKRRFRQPVLVALSAQLRAKMSFDLFPSVHAAYRHTPLIGFSTRFPQPEEISRIAYLIPDSTGDESNWPASPPSESNGNQSNTRSRVGRPHLCTLFLVLNQCFTALKKHDAEVLLFAASASETRGSRLFRQPDLTVRAAGSENTGIGKRE